MKATLSTPQQGSTSQLTGRLGGDSAQLDTPGQTNKADVNATLRKLSQVTMDIYASSRGVT